MKFLSSAEKSANGVLLESLSFTIFEMRLIEVLSPRDCYDITRLHVPGAFAPIGEAGVDKNVLPAILYCC